MIKHNFYYLIESRYSENVVNLLNYYSYNCFNNSPGVFETCLTNSRDSIYITHTHILDIECILVTKHTFSINM